jgi:hypothetical protein
MDKITNGADIPVGLAVALGKCQAMDAFFSLSGQTQQRIIEYTLTIESKTEMLDYIQTIFGLK